MIGDDIIITVVDLRGDKVRLGIDAPKEVPVHRDEVYQALQREAQKNHDLFKEHLESKRYGSAFDMIYENRTDPEQWLYRSVTRNEINTMNEGLRQKIES